MKIYVYAISKNEEKFVDRWVNSMKEADGIFVLDTGSTDKTITKLKKLGVDVKKKIIKPWRFDVARNESLKLVPDDADICICTDLDEIFVPGWRKKIESIWNHDTTRLRYNYNWLLDENDIPKVNFYIEKIHKRDGYKWIYPVHEVLSYEGTENIVTTDEITLNHYPDREKSRSSYLPLLELSIKENPESDRNIHYLGREYMYYHEWNKSIDMLEHHLQMPTATWKDERCASMRFIARDYINLGRYEEAKMWLDKAMLEAPYLRDPFIERAFLSYTLEEWNETKKYCLEALKITTHPKTYINEPFSFDETVYDLLSLAEYYLGNKSDAIKWLDIAIEINPNNERLKQNKEIIMQNESDIN